jgi:hypothetical protein
MLRTGFLRTDTARKRVRLNRFLVTLHLFQHNTSKPRKQCRLHSGAKCGRFFTGLEMSLPVEFLEGIVKSGEIVKAGETDSVLERRLSAASHA